MSENYPSGAKAQRLFSATCGPAEAVPFQNFGHLVVFPQPVKPIISYQPLAAPFDFAQGRLLKPCPFKT
jgi:hypothetical protein